VPSEEGIQPPRSGKSRKVAISGVVHQSVVDGQGGQVGIWDEIGMNPRHGKKLPQRLGVVLRRSGNPHRLTDEPGLHLTLGVRDRFRTFEHPRIRHEPQEGKQTWPWQADRCGAVHLPVKSVTRALVLSEGAYMGADEDIGVDHDCLQD
jgi:hypothetical protein